MLLQWYLQIESHFKLLLPHVPAICLKIPLFDHFLAIYGFFSPFVLSKGLSLCPISTCIDKKNFTGCCWNDICKEEATPGCYYPIFPLFAWKFIFLAIFDHSSLFVPAQGQPFDPTATFIDKNIITGCSFNNIYRERAAPYYYHSIFLPFAWKLSLVIFGHFSPFVPAYGQPLDFTFTYIEKNTMTGCCCN